MSLDWLKVQRAIVISGAVVLVASITLGRWLPETWWVLWLIQHLRVQLLIALLIVTLILLGLRCHRVAALTAAALVLHGVTFLPILFGAADGTPALSITHINTDQNADALTYANNSGADIVFLQELHTDVASDLELMSNYEVVLAVPMDNTQGSAMLVNRQWPGSVVHSEIVNIHHYERPLITAQVRVAGKLLTLMSFHAIRPLSGPTITAHQTEMTNLAKWVAAQTSPVVVVGDFNATPWSSAVDPLNEIGLVHAGKGHGLQATWPASRPSLFRIPIDLGFHSPSWTTTLFRSGDDVGSDHLPLHIELAPKP